MDVRDVWSRATAMAVAPTPMTVPTKPHDSGSEVVAESPPASVWRGRARRAACFADG